ncbi:MarR family winged helix-turn-helix transcriptional regulator [Aquimarina algicola]|uniref:Winged helix-turn-helix transcriptional regulator n=1 Tax=Aquimarina algicola TaxID=2589995 RepID=A0A504JEU2_9FLAO|nr:MarR family winged helix-turn-helix transcriptional regulator [Aquimarina algicola]TPN86965.1 winged helix-turn-helix transcriptional regulator [Aquimarina algicola]
MKNDIDYKITQALERISKTFRVLLWEESKEFGISPIQIQILIFCLTHTEDMLKVSLLAKEFDLTKATVSDSIKVLLKKELLIKVPDTYDARSYTVRLTKEGRDIANKTLRYTSALETAINPLGNDKKELLFNNLLKIIDSLSKKSVISVQRMCFTCQHYSQNNNTSYCNFLQKSLSNKELQIDCDDHKIIE